MTPTVVRLVFGQMALACGRLVAGRGDRGPTLLWLRMAAILSASVSFWKYSITGFRLSFGCVSIRPAGWVPRVIEGEQNQCPLLLRKHQVILRPHSAAPERTSVIFCSLINSISCCCICGDAGEQWGRNALVSDLDKCSIVSSANRLDQRKANPVHWTVWYRSTTSLAFLIER